MTSMTNATSSRAGPRSRSARLGDDLVEIGDQPARCRRVPRRRIIHWTRAGRPAEQRPPQRPCAAAAGTCVAAIASALLDGSDAPASSKSRVCNGYIVTVNVRNPPRPVLDPLFDVESDSDL